jgi:hypothetical protein
MANKIIIAIAAGVVALGATTFVACGSSDDNPAPGNNTTDSGIPTVDTGTKTDTGSTTDSGSPTDSGTPSDSGTGDVADTTPWDPDSGTCFPGTPTTNIELLNACPGTGVTCVSFDNKTRCPKLNPDGTLPALP